MRTRALRLAMTATVISLVFGCGEQRAPLTSDDVASRDQTVDRPLLADSTLADAPGDAALAGRSPLLVNSGAEAVTLAVLDPETGEMRPVPVPSELEGERTDRALVGPGGRFVLTTGDAGSALWDRSEDNAEFLGHGGRIGRMFPPADPSVVLLETNAAISLVDLTRGGVHELTELMVGWPDGVSPALAADASNGVALVSGPGGGAIAVDLESGLLVSHDESLLFYERGLAGDGSTAIAGRRTPVGRAIEAIDPFDPTRSASWYVPGDRFEQVSIAWVGGRLLAVDVAGRILDVTDGGTDELARIPPSGDDRPIVALIRSDRSSPDVALVEVRRREVTEWFRFDRRAGEVDELAEADGHPHLVARLGTTVALGSGDFAAGFTSLVLVDVENGSVTPVLADEAMPTRLVMAHGQSVLQLIGSDGGSRFYDSDGRLLGELDEPVSDVDPVTGAVAVVVRGSGRELSTTTWIVDLDGTDATAYTDTYPLRWLPVL